MVKRRRESRQAARTNFKCGCGDGECAEGSQGDGAIGVAEARGKLAEQGGGRGSGRRGGGIVGRREGGIRRGLGERQREELNGYLGRVANARPIFGNKRATQRDPERGRRRTQVQVVPRGGGEREDGRGGPRPTGSAVLTSTLWFCG